MLKLLHSAFVRVLGTGTQGIRLVHKCSLPIRLFLQPNSGTVEAPLKCPGEGGAGSQGSQLYQLPFLSLSRHKELRKEGFIAAPRLRGHGHRDGEGMEVFMAVEVCSWDS